MCTLLYLQIAKELYLHCVLPVSVSTERILAMNGYNLSKSGDFVGVFIAQVKNKSVEFSLLRDQIIYY